MQQQFLLHPFEKQDRDRKNSSLLQCWTPSDRSAIAVRVYNNNTNRLSSVMLH